MLKIKLLTVINPDKIIHAIKDLRAATGLGLKESKDAVDALRGAYGLAPATVDIEVSPDKVHLLYTSFTYEVLAKNESSYYRLALRAAVMSVRPSTLEGLATAMEIGSDERALLENAAEAMRSVGV